MTGAQRRAMYGSAIREQRMLRGLHQSQLALLVGASQPALSRWENGVTDVPESVQNALAVVFGIPASRLFPFVRIDGDRELLAASA